MKAIQPRQVLTPRRLELLRAIGSFWARRCYSPTIGELAGQLGVSRSTAFEHIDELRRKGLLSRSPGRARSLRLTCQAHELLEGLFSEQPERQGAVEATAVPLAGRVAAGIPIEALEDKESISLKEYFGTGDDVFALEVRGQSMIDQDILDGDIVICRRRPNAENGQLVIAVVDDQGATLKRFYKEGDFVRLEAANRDYAPIYSANCRIEAVVVGLIRKL